jgi:hypothetical protein
MENEKVDTVEWSRETVLKAIELYRDHCVLWDPTCTEFKDRNAKNNAWTDIVLALNVSKFEIQMKIKKLIGQFQRESKKNKSGSGADGRSKWFAFEAMQFIRDKSEMLITFVTKVK